MQFILWLSMVAGVIWCFVTFPVVIGLIVAVVFYICMALIAAAISGDRGDY
jgi:hypothetical protein